MFPDVQIVREVQIELDKVIEEGVINIVQLLKNNENEYSSRTSFLDEDKLEVCQDSRIKVLNSLGSAKLDFRTIISDVSVYV